jgi:NAD(P)-dependent dehydrogenase (short-subunit alcohol dehydrogenase family)/acyl carrier protein
LTSLALQQPKASPTAERIVIPTLRGARERQSERAFTLGAQGKLWLAGVALDWAAIHQHARRQRLPLPTYPFERQRYWIERQHLDQRADQRQAALHKKPAQREWLYEPSWKRTPLAHSFDGRRLSEHAGGWLVFLDAVGLGAALVERLRQAGQQVITARAGEQFGRFAEHDYTLDPQQPADYAALLADLQTRQLSFDRVVHLWSVTPAAVSFEQAQQTGFYSLIFLAQALEQQRAADPLALTVISSGVQAVTGEEPLQPEKATALGPTRIIAQEYPHIRCRSIDVALPAPESRRAQLADQLLADLATPSSDFAVAYRGLYRWVQSFEPLPLDEAHADPPRLRENGVYLITGGLGYVGLTLAHELTRAPGVRLALVGRSALPDRAMWDYWLAGHDESDAVSEKIRAVQTLEQRGATVLTISADVADQGLMRSVIQRVKDEFGALHGVIHAAGATGEQAFRAIHNLGPTESGWQFQAKVHGLQALEAALAEHELDFCILCSSLASMLGGLGFSAYAAANLYMDAFAHRHNQEHATPWISVNWEAWQPPAHLERRTGLGAALAELAITADEGAQLFRRIIALPPSAQIVISTADLAARLDHWSGRAPAQEQPEQPSEQRALHPRRNIATTYVAPVTEHEQRIAEICEHLLGVTPVGIHDNFFDLGGHSLLAVQLISRLRSEFQVDVSLHTVFESPTIAQLAAHVAASRTQDDQAETLEAMLQMVEHLSEDEIATLLLGGRQE